MKLAIGLPQTPIYKWKCFPRYTEYIEKTSLLPIPKDIAFGLTKINKTKSL